MRRPLLAAAVAAFLVSCPSIARAEPWSRFDDVRVGFRGITYGGTRREGEGSIARLTQGAVDFEFAVMRFFRGPIGVDVGVAFLPPISDLRDMGYGRLDAALDVGLVRWGGAVPGALIVGAGMGGDFGRYSYDGRFYPRLVARLRLKPSAHVSLFVTTEVVPAAVGPALRVFETRTELGFAWRLLAVGFRVAHVVESGGLPPRDYVQQQLGLFVGVGVL